MPQDELLRSLTKFTVDFDCTELGPAFVHEVKRHVIDAIGCGLGGLVEGPPAAARRYVQTWQSPRGVTVLGTTFRVAPDLAAFANGFAIRYLDFNDTSMSPDGGHSSDNIAPVLAAAEWARAEPADVLAAIVIGYEIQDRLGDLFSIRDRGFDHVTYLAVSSAAAAARVLGADGAQAANAIAIAATTNTAHLQIRRDLVPIRGLATASAVRAGLHAALLVRHGLTGPSEPFAGRAGWFANFVGGDRALPAFGPSGGRPLKLQESRFKAFPADYETQAAIAPAIRLHDRLAGTAAQIEAVTVHTSQRAIDIAADRPERWRPVTREIADHSLPFVIATTLTKGGFWLDDLAPEQFQDRLMWELMERIECRADPEFSRRHGETYGVRIEVRLDTGTSLLEEVELPLGHPGNPLTDGQLDAKFDRLARRVMPAERADAARRALWALDVTRDWAALMQALAADLDGNGDE
jgi:2-methylcitrate dehydratase